MFYLVNNTRNTRCESADIGIIMSNRILKPWMLGLLNNNNIWLRYWNMKKKKKTMSVNRTNISIFNTGKTNIHGKWSGFIRIWKIEIATFFQKKWNSYHKIIKTLLTPPFHENSSVLLNNLFLFWCFFYDKT